MISSALVPSCVEVQHSVSQAAAEKFEENLRAVSSLPDTKQPGLLSGCHASSIHLSSSARQVIALSNQALQLFQRVRRAAIDLEEMDLQRLRQTCRYLETFRDHVVPDHEDPSFFSSGTVLSQALTPTPFEYSWMKETGRKSGGGVGSPLSVQRLDAHPVFLSLETEMEKETERVTRLMESAKTQKRKREKETGRENGRVCANDEEVRLQNLDRAIEALTLVTRDLNALLFGGLSEEEGDKEGGREGGGSAGRLREAREEWERTKRRVSMMPERERNQMRQRLQDCFDRCEAAFSPLSSLEEETKAVNACVQEAAGRGPERRRRSEKEATSGNAASLHDLPDPLEFQRRAVEVLGDPREASRLSALVAGLAQIPPNPHLPPRVPARPPPSGGCSAEPVAPPPLIFPDAYDVRDLQQLLERECIAGEAACREEEQECEALLQNVEALLMKETESKKEEAIIIEY
uniref:Uncharacterized protein n=1 Tax=Chromera velia CCMP2878 TaxID=1169474 RepID=A0A0G4F3P8_9ALVE|eukprot:Cvel_14869.t1-p1 / transcript=Cvel_14869.t1 / gene=Cvel_14869 / organism=Chromera_velia_CCMP2878 / gene_product=hypothetical protein / transcript_product=hypothetical protein / location=Cvel_scaffold1075:29478-33113(-) / protein_length=462 / sequence_SO=supercontig / SO=protein_coding / is_pseudo=false